VRGEFVGDLLVGSHGAGRSNGCTGRSTGLGRGLGADRGKATGDVVVARRRGSPEQHAAGHELPRPRPSAA
jgi:hypothetical protein